MSDPTSISNNRSKLKEFIASIATIRGDLSNITAPPFVLSTISTVELPSFWAERPSVFVAPAAVASAAAVKETTGDIDGPDRHGDGQGGDDDPAQRRALLVLRWFLSALRGQQYAGRKEEEGIKKPLNAFLGEVFLGKWVDDDEGTTWVVSEQVSHHPPVTACRVWNDKYGISAEGYTRQEISFNGNVNVRQIGHATLHLSRHNETYLIPLPDVKIKGILTGSPYPELQGTYHIPCTSGYTSRIEFGGKSKGSWFSSADKKHGFEARLYRDRDDGDRGGDEGKGEEGEVLYTVSGTWDSEFTIHDVQRGQDIETFDVRAATTETKAPAPPTVAPLEDQDPWESRRAWHAVRTALQKGDMQGAADAKAAIENGQREMRKSEGDGDDDGKSWQRLFFEPVTERCDPVAEVLARRVGVRLDPKDTVAAWRFRRAEWEAGGFRRPFRGGLMPDGSIMEREKKDVDMERDVSTTTAVLNGTGPVSMQGEQLSTQVDSGSADGEQWNKEPQGDDRVEKDHVNDTGSTTAMTAGEKGRVEDFLRHKYASSGRWGR